MQLIRHLILVGSLAAVSAGVTAQTSPINSAVVFPAKSAVSAVQQKNMAVARLGFEMFNVTHDLSRVREVYSEDLVFYENNTYAFSGLSKYIEWAEKWTDAMNEKAELTGQMVGDGFVVSFYHASATATGEMYGVKPHGAKIDGVVTYIDVFRDGKIVEHRSYYDAASTLEQIGAIKLPNWEPPAKKKR
jgi:predicted ester cyclase